MKKDNTYLKILRLKEKTMIYTLTLNPAIDYLVKAENFAVGKLNRLSEEKMLVGGKGINVSQVLKNLSVPSVALGFVAGFTGDQIRNHLESLNIKTDFVTLKEGASRINVKIKGEPETELNAKGPFVSEDKKEELFKKLDSLKSGDILVLSGGNAKGLESDIYKEIIEKQNKKGVKCVLDASGELFKNAISLKPWLVKPNKDEAEELLNLKIDSIQKAIDSAKEISSMGAQNVLLTLGGEGMIYLNAEGECYKASAICGEVQSAVGAGDSAVAGFLAGHVMGENSETCLKLALAAGSATAFSEGLASGEEIMNLKKSAKAERVY